MDRFATDEPPLRVLRVYHSGVVSTWRERDRQIRVHGADVTLVTPRRWNEGGADVALDASHEPWVVASRTIGRHPFRFAYNPLPIIALLRRNSFDIIDIHEEPASLATWEVRLLARWFGHRTSPVLLYSAQNLEKRYPIPFRWMERAALKHAKALYPCNTEAGDILQRKGFRGIVTPLPLGVDIAGFTPTAPSGQPFTVGYVGRLDEHKGVQIAVKAFARLDGEPHMVLAGDGKQRSDLERLAVQLGISGRVTFVGHRSQEETNLLYRTFDVLVMPSQTRHNWVEQFGRVAVEAMASGVPLVVSNSGALPEVVGGAGLVVPEADVEAWVRALTSLQHDPTARSVLRAQGLERAKSFDWAAIAATQVRLYREVLA